MAVEYKKRARTKDTAVGQQRIYDSRCGNYRLVQSQVKLGENRGNRYPDRWYAMLICGGHEKILSTHRKRTGAESAIEKYDRRTAGSTK